MYPQLKYVGHPRHLELLKLPIDRYAIRGTEDVLNWMNHEYVASSDWRYVATFIVDSDGELWIASRRSEHVVCANGGTVLSAGEITFQRTESKIEIVEISNQSTGYCPDPDTWPAVSECLSTANLSHPSDFTSKFTFRRCQQCENLNIVREGWFYCAICDAELDKSWNITEELK